MENQNWFDKMFPCFSPKQDIDLGKIKELEDAGVEPVFMITQKKGLRNEIQT